MTLQPVRHKILIVDDVSTNIKILGQALRQEYDISIGTNGQKALEIAASEHPPDLILLDIMMPEMDGYEVCRRLKSDPKSRNIPVIFITTKDEIEDETKGLGLGAVDYIVKPFRLPIVLARVRTHLILKRKTDLLESLVSIDGLTEIPNRRRFDEMLDHEWRRTMRVAASLSMIMMDIDFFKDFNDNYGHAVGDECLQKVAHTLEHSVKRASDFVARYGGEEFAAILPETTLEAALNIAERIRTNVENLEIPHAFSQVSDHVTLSLGVATLVPTSDMDPNDLLKAADNALYKAKEAGRNRVE
jgi:diguanylate cyclase (GGDEF)-like protein